VGVDQLDGVGSSFAAIVVPAIGPALLLFDPGQQAAFLGLAVNRHVLLSPAWRL
jgi:hypothetical protein